MGTFHRLSFIPSVSLTELKMLENLNKKNYQSSRNNNANDNSNNNNDNLAGEQEIINF